jgi:hypothetical protein
MITGYSELLSYTGKCRMLSAATRKMPDIAESSSLYPVIVCFGIFLSLLSRYHHHHFPFNLYLL